MHFKVSPGLTVHQTNLDFFQIIFFELCSVVKTLLFEFLNLFKTLLFCSFIIFKRTQGTRIPSNYIYFKKTTN